MDMRALPHHVSRLRGRGFMFGKRLARRGLRASRIVPRRLPRVLVQRPEARLELTLDHLIARLLLDNDDLVFVQIGAFDGRTGDQLWKYVNRYHWTGILVEPQRKSFEALQRTYAEHPELELRNVAISDKAGLRTLYTIREVVGLPEWATQLASFDRAQVDKHNLRAPQGDDLVVAETVECVTLDHLLADVQRVDLLQVDVEGYDAEIIRMFDFDKYSPRVVRFEHAHLSTGDHNAAVQRLVERGYQVALTHFDTLGWLPTVQT